MSVEAIAILVQGLILGLAHAPALLIGGYVAERICRANPAQMVIAILVWALCFFLWMVLLNQIDIQLWAHANRRKYSNFLLIGVVVGVFLSYRIVGRYKGKSD